MDRQPHKELGGPLLKYGQLKIETKPLQMETWLILTACKTSLAPYPMVPLSNP